MWVCRGDYPRVPSSYACWTSRPPRAAHAPSPVPTQQTRSRESMKYNWCHWWLLELPYWFKAGFLPKKGFLCEVRFNQREVRLNIRKFGKLKNSENWNFDILSICSVQSGVNNCGYKWLQIIAFMVAVFLMRVHTETNIYGFSHYGHVH